MFAGKHGFITLRDLFRWADRYRLEEQTDASRDWLQHLADDGKAQSNHTPILRKMHIFVFCLLLFPCLLGGGIVSMTHPLHIM